MTGNKANLRPAGAAALPELGNKLGLSNAKLSSGRFQAFSASD